MSTFFVLLLEIVRCSIFLLCNKAYEFIYYDGFIRVTVRSLILVVAKGVNRIAYSHTTRSERQNPVRFPITEEKKITSKMILKLDSYFSFDLDVNSICIYIKFQCCFNWYSNFSYLFNELARSMLPVSERNFIETEKNTMELR